MAEPAFEYLRRRLFEGGIAPRRARRLLQELRDHYAELVLEQQRKGSARPADAALVRLGSEESLATHLLARRELLSWSRRWPWAVYGLAPLVLFPAAFVTTICVMVALGHILNGMRHSAPVLFLEMMHAIRFFDLYLLPVLAALGLALLVRRRGVSIAWGRLSILLFALMGSLTNIQVNIHQIGAGAGVTSRPAVLIGLFLHRALPMAASAVSLYTVALYWSSRRQRVV
jgi:hypothetical protein